MSVLVILLVLAIIIFIILFSVLIAGVWRISSASTVSKDVVVNSAVGQPSNLKFDPTIQNLTASIKNFALPTNTDIVVADITGKGIVKKLWLALSGEPQNTSVNVFVDGQSVPSFGNTSMIVQSGLNTSPVMASMLLGINGKNTGTVSTSFMTDINGMNRDRASDSLGGYLSLDMPFSSSIKIVIRCISNNNQAVYNGFSQIFYEPELRIPAPFQFLRLYTSTFSWSSNFGNEYPLLNAKGPYGVFLKGVKMVYEGNSGSWYEGRHRAYIGGPGMMNPFSSMHYTDNSYSTVTPYDPSAQIIMTSSGAEDFHLSSWGFINNPNGTSSNSSGYLYTSNPTTEASPNSFSASATWIATRYFGEGNESGLPHSQANQNMLFTFACGDPIANNTGNCNVSGIVFYYA